MTLQLQTYSEDIFIESLKYDVYDLIDDVKYKLYVFIATEEV